LAVKLLKREKDIFIAQMTNDIRQVVCYLTAI